MTFSIDIPDLDPTIKGRVESALSTEDKRLKQLLTLLLSGSFVPDEQSGIVNNTTVLYSNASEIMANQLNNVFRQLNIPLDLGFNYQPGENGRDIFDVAVSTQLFNNRVNINGNIDNRQYMTSNQSDLVGDVDMEIKIDRTGRIRLTLSPILQTNIVTILTNCAQWNRVSPIKKNLMTSGNFSERSSGAKTP